MKMSVHVEEWSTKAPFRISGLSRNAFRVVVVEIGDRNHKGRGEGLPIHYLQETVDGLCSQIDEVASALESGIAREALLKIMPAGGARNAIDTALWDLEAKRTNQSIWDLTGILPKPVRCAITIGIEETPEETGRRAAELAVHRILKIKLDSDRPLERVAAVRAARPDATLAVDANRAWNFELLVELAPRLADLGVALIEQPLPRGEDEQLETYVSPVPLCADESCQHRGELDEAARRYQVVNVKLDKAGGLTEALLLARAAREKGLGVYVGNMGGTSLSMAPAFVVAQLCDHAELDGPLILKHDRLAGLSWRDEQILGFDPALWGHPLAPREA